MAEKPYQWAAGAALEEHSKRKHKILQEYFARYLAVRCQLPQQQRFRLAVVEGFAGGGRYSDGAPGSPIIFIEELRVATERFNIVRAAHGMSPLDIECLLILNDSDRSTIELLKENVAPVLVTAREQTPRLHLRVEYMTEIFERAYPEIRVLLSQGRYRNVLFNLDQYGYSHVSRETLVDIMNSFVSAEVFYTFAIESLLAFLQKSNPQLVAARLGFLGIKAEDLSTLEQCVSNRTWLGAAERMVFDCFSNCAQYVSPFSINNPKGWRYWFIHFANSYRARQEYNIILHSNSSLQAHFGRAGLNMLYFDPTHGSNALYLFDLSGRSEAVNQLSDDIPRLVSEFGDAVGIGEFYESIYNMTPAHMDDVHAAIIQSPDLEVMTKAGGERRKPNTITLDDVLRVKKQRSFFPIFFGGNRGPK